MVAEALGHRAKSGPETPKVRNLKRKLYWVVMDINTILPKLRSAFLRSSIDSQWHNRAFKLFKQIPLVSDTEQILVARRREFVSMGEFSCEHQNTSI
jgi:hypothetical protein